MGVDLSSVGAAFQAERMRLKLGVQETADICGVTRNAISKIERTGALPSGAVLAAFAAAGADIHRVLTGKPRPIDYTLLGVVEAAIIDAYCAARPTAPRPRAIRTRQVVLAYEQVAGQITPDDDVGAAAMREAERLIARLNDPLDPEMLDRNLLPPALPQVVAGVTATGGSIASGRDTVIGNRGATK